MTTKKARTQRETHTASSQTTTTRVTAPATTHRLDAHEIVLSLPRTTATTTTTTTTTPTRSTTLIANHRHEVVQGLP